MGMVTVAERRYAENTHEYTGRPRSSPMMVGIAVETTVDSSEASAVTRTRAKVTARPRLHGHLGGELGRSGQEADNRPPRRQGGTHEDLPPPGRNRPSRALGMGRPRRRRRLRPRAGSRGSPAHRDGRRPRSEAALSRGGGTDAAQGGGAAGAALAQGPRA